jgi:hypothetical protein
MSSNQPGWNDVQSKTCRFYSLNGTSNLQLKVPLRSKNLLCIVICMEAGLKRLNKVFRLVEIPIKKMSFEEI